jgi:putative endonuclease
MTNQYRTTFYIGVTNDISIRVWQHVNESSGFVKRYKCFYLVYFEHHMNIVHAIEREK